MDWNLDYGGEDFAGWVGLKFFIVIFVGWKQYFITQSLFDLVVNALYLEGENNPLHEALTDLYVVNALYLEGENNQ